MTKVRKPYLQLRAFFFFLINNITETTLNLKCVQQSDRGKFRYPN